MINKYNIYNEEKYFSSDGLKQNLVLISTGKIELICNDGRYSRIDFRGSTEMSEERIKNRHILDVNFAVKIINKYNAGEVKFRGICLKQDIVSFFIKNVAHLYVTYIYKYIWTRYMVKWFKRWICSR